MPAVEAHDRQEIEHAERQMRQGHFQAERIQQAPQRKSSPHAAERDQHIALARSALHPLRSAHRTAAV